RTRRMSTTDRCHPAGGRPLACHLVARRGRSRTTIGSDHCRPIRRRTVTQPSRQCHSKLRASVSSVTWPTVIGQLIDNTDLPAQYTDWAMDQIMSDAATPAQLAGFAVALRAKGETAAEISGMADAMLRHAHTVEMPTRAVDIVGTGGD